LIAVLLLAPQASAIDLWTNESGERIFSLDTTLKFTGLTARAPSDPILFPERTSHMGLTRLRLSFDYSHEDWMNAQFAYEQRANYQSSGGVSGSRLLPSSAEAPYRIVQLDDQISGNNHYSWDHEIDRAYMAFHPEWGEVTLGRQAIGMGRALFFGVLDVFSPFTPTEVDRDWRRGVDAFRVEYRLSETSSAELLAVAGRSGDESAVLARYRGYFGNLDLEFVAGKRGRDAMAAAALSAVVGDAEAHIEFGLFHTPEDQIDGGLFGNDRLIPKAVLGGSYTFDVSRGLTLFAEYHYNGFGIEDSEDFTMAFLDPDLQARFLRGDMQIAGRHAIAVQTSYPITDEWTTALLVMNSPKDGSGLLSPSATWSISDRATLLMSGIVPWGPGPQMGTFDSEYGSSSTSLFLQLNLYF
jgi:hypothetical protein